MCLFVSFVCVFVSVCVLFTVVVVVCFCVFDRLCVFVMMSLVCSHVMIAFVRFVCLFCVC